MLVGGAGATGSREADAFLTTTVGRGELGVIGESILVEVVDGVREREKTTGDGDGVLGEEEVPRLRGCSGGTGAAINVTFAVEGRWSMAPTVIPLGRTRAGVERLRIR